MENWPALINVLGATVSAYNSVAYSPDGRLVVSGSRDSCIRIWDVDTGALKSEPFEGHTTSISSVKFSPDGRRIVSASIDGTIRIWDAETSQTYAGPFRYDKPTPKLVHWDELGRPITPCVRYVEFSPDGNEIVYGIDNAIRILDANTGEIKAEILQAHADLVTSVAFAPDGRRLVSSSRDGTMRIWDAELYHAVAHPIRVHAGPVMSVKFSPDGKRIVSGSQDSTIRVCDAETGGLLLEARHHASVLSVAYSPDGKRIVSSSEDGTVCIWDAESVELVGGPFDDHTDSVLSADFSPDGRWVVTCSPDKTIRVWDAHAGVVAPKQPDSQLRAGEAIPTFTADGKHIVGRANAWDVETGEIVPVPKSFRRTSPAAEGLDSPVQYSRDGTRIVLGLGDGSIRIWDATTGDLMTSLVGHTGPISSVAVSPDGKRIISASGDLTTRVWIIDEGQMRAEMMKIHDTGSV